MDGGVYHGRLTKWRFVKEQLICNQFIPIIGNRVRVVTACLNALGDPDWDQRDVKMVQTAASLQEGDNFVTKRVREHTNMARRAKNIIRVSKEHPGFEDDVSAILEFPYRQ